MVFEYFGHFTLDLIHCACNVIDYKFAKCPHSGLLTHDVPFENHFITV
jgi:hypothetical protein